MPPPGPRRCRFCSGPVPEPSAGWVTARGRLSLDRPLIMGIVNVTPDSFSDGGLHLDPSAAIEGGRSLVAAGADLVDVGGESTRPGAAPVDAGVELSRVLPVVRGLVKSGIVVSVDTAKAEVAAACLSEGAAVINDVTAGADPRMWETVAGHGAGYVAMHMRGTPRTMQVDPHYDDVVAEVASFLVTQSEAATAAGVDPAGIVIDPGIGFGKTAQHNLELLRRLPELVATGYPVLIGASRKAFLGVVTGVEDPSRRDVPTAAVTALAVAWGAAGVRVHDVAVSRHAATIAHAVSRASDLTH